VGRIIKYETGKNNTKLNSFIDDEDEDDNKEEE
jgi:hypothetical protein